MSSLPASAVAMLTDAPQATGSQWACWLAPRLLLTISKRAADDPPEGDFSPLLRHTNGHGRQALGTLSVARLNDGVRRSSLHLTLHAFPEDLDEGVRSQMEEEESQPDVFPAEQLLDFKTLLRQQLAPLRAADRQKVLHWLVTATEEIGSRSAATLSENLALAKDCLRERLTPVVISREAHRGMHVDNLFALDNQGFYIRGWASVACGALSRLTVVSPEGIRVELLKRLFRHARPDIDQLYGVTPDVDGHRKDGFLSYFELPVASRLARGWILEAVDQDGHAFETSSPSPCREAAQARQFLLGDLYHEKLPKQEFRANHVLPAIRRLQERHYRNLRFAWVQEYGQLPARPAVSLIVPLYRRVDFLEHQMAQFVRDPELKGADIIYVLDSPELAEGLRESAAGLFQVYRVPFRLAALESNAGFAGANNLAAGLARGRLLLLLNSDVLPDRAGWLSRMITFHDSKPRLGAVGAKLLFEDDTLQHAGMYFRRAPISGLWENQHFYKGLDRQLTAANTARRVPAVSAACLLMSRQLYLQHEGLRGIYVQGDYEDSDLCLRLQQDGREIWYCPEAELYHLEGQSYLSEDRSRNLGLNRWIHTHFWNEQIAQLMRDETAACDTYV